MKGLVRMRIRDWSFVLLVCLLAMTALAIVAAAAEVTPPPEGNLFINQANSPATITSRTVFVNGNIIVDSAGALTITNSVVTVNSSVVINTFGSLSLVNSTLRFNCTTRSDNFLRVEESGTLTVRDEDANRETTGDRSVITSVNDIRFNITVAAKANLRIYESLISLAGRHSPMGTLPEGVQVKSDNAEVRGTRFERCFVGLVIDSAEKVKVSNCTFDQCEYAGIFMRGVIEAKVEDCTVTRGLRYGILMRGFASKMTLSRCDVSGSAEAEMELVTLSGDSNLVNWSTFGPGPGVGVRATEAEAVTFAKCAVTRCATGIELALSKLTFREVAIDNCTTGLKAVSGTYTLEDVSVLDTTAGVDPGVVGNLSCKSRMRIDRSRLDLGRFLVVQTNGVLNVTNSTLSFRLSKGAPTGVIVESKGALGMVDCTVDSPVSRLLVFKLMPLCVFELRASTISSIGSPTSAPVDSGLYIAGGGLISGIVVQDCETGLVSGRTQARIVDVTVRRCKVAILSDGQVGPGGMKVERLTVEDCQRVAVLRNDGSLIIESSSITIGLEGFNLTRSQLNLRDCALGRPGTGGITAFLADRSTVSLTNSSFSNLWGWGAGDNEVRVSWYLKMSFTHIEPAGTPLANGTVTVKNVMGQTEVAGLSTGPQGRPPVVDVRERTITRDNEISSTPHTITVAWGDASDALVETMDMNREVSFALDTTPPSVSITGLVDGTVYNVSAFRVLVEGVDPVRRAAKGPWRLAIRADNGTWDEVQTTGFEGAAWTFDLNLTDGPHLVEAYVRDASGNRAAASVSLVVDTTPPAIEVIYPPLDMPPVNRTSVTLLGSTDPGANLTINGERVVVGATGSFSHTVSLVEGPNRITLAASDALGNQRVVHVDITVDTTAPTVVLDPVGGVTNASFVVISGTKERGATLYVNKALPDLTDAERFEVTVALVEGDNLVHIGSVDVVGNEWHTSLTVVRDSTPPELSVVPPPGQTRFARVTVQGLTEPGATVTVNGAPVTNADGAFTTQLDLQPGENVITIIARDALGNQADVAVFTVVLDTVAPSLAVTSLRQVETDLDHTQLNGTTDAGAIVRVRVTYGAYTKSYSAIAGPAGAFTFSIELPQIGSHSVVVTVEDAAGNTASETLTYERVFPEQPEPDGDGDESTWLKDNWVYLVLVAAILLGAAVLLISIVPSKRQLAARRRLVEARAARARQAAAAAEAAEEAGAGDEGAGPEEGTDAPEGGGEGAEGDGGPEGTDAAGDRADRGWEEMGEEAEGESEVDEAVEEADK